MSNQLEEEAKQQGNYLAKEDHGQREATMKDRPTHTHINRRELDANFDVPLDPNQTRWPIKVRTIAKRAKDKSNCPRSVLRLRGRGLPLGPQYLKIKCKIYRAINRARITNAAGPRPSARRAIQDHDQVQDV